MNDFLKNLFTVFPVNHRRKVYVQVKRQRILSRSGQVATARVMEIVKEGHGIYNYVKIRVGVTIHTRTETVYRQLYTLVSKDNLPEVGEVIPIRFSPDDVSGTMVIAE